MSETVLITGVGGPAGRAGASYFARKGYRVVGTDLRELASPATELRLVPPASDDRFVPALLEIATREKAALVVSTVTEELPVVARMRGALRERGVQVSVDDFGAGFTSLSQLRGLPVHQLKIDRQFITALETSPDDDAVVTAIIDLGHRLGLTIVAEGVETEAAAERLRQLRCDDLQGFWFARPMVAGDVLGWAGRRSAGVPVPGGSTSGGSVPVAREPAPGS